MKSLEEIAREGAQKVLTQAIENEVEEFIQNYCNQRDKKGHRIGKRNGYLPERPIQTGIGLIVIKKPRTRGEAFTMWHSSPLSTSSAKY